MVALTLRGGFSSLYFVSYTCGEINGPIITKNRPFSMKKLNHVAK